MGALAKYLAQPTVVEPSATPTETVFDKDGNYTQTCVLPRQPANADDILEIFGHDPEAFTVEGNVSVAHRELVDGRMVSTYRYKLAERRQPIDIDDLMKRAAKAKPHKAVKSEGDHWFTFHAPDLQLGKVASGGGTAEILAQHESSLDAAVEEFKLLRRKGIEGVLLAFAGDCLEGWYSQGSKNVWLTSETLTEQVRIFRRLLLHTVERFASLTDHVILAVVNGNHDDAQRVVNTKPGDGFAVDCAIAVSDALEMNPDAYGHVKVIVPNEWRAHMTFEVGDTIIAMTHGHLSRPGKAMAWWGEQSFGKQSPGAADVLLTGHYHNLRLETNSGRTWIQGTTMDTGSDWYQDAHGCESDRGAVTFLLRGGKVSHLGVV